MEDQEGKAGTEAESRTLTGLPDSVLCPVLRRACLRASCGLPRPAQVSDGEGQVIPGIVDAEMGAGLLGPGAGDR